MSRDKKATRIFFATDVHGSERTFRKFLNAGKVYKADVVMLCGDLTGKMLIPLVKENDGTFRCTMFDQNYLIKTPEELARMKERIADVGFYSYETSQAELDQIKSVEGKAGKIFTQLIIERLSAWLSLAKKHLKDTTIKCYVSPGNDDCIEVDDVLNKDDFVINGDRRVVQVDDIHPMITLGNSNLTPWHCPRDITEDEFARLINEVADHVDSMENCIFNIHVPPVNTGIDSASMLDDSVYPPRRVIDRGQPVEVGVGSMAVRSAIEKYQPLLGLHGHIHESRGVAKIGRTVCLNPGSEYAECVLRGVLVIISDRKVQSYQFTSG